jgi:hypothetical protein
MLDEHLDVKPIGDDSVCVPSPRGSYTAPLLTVSKVPSKPLETSDSAMCVTIAELASMYF